MFASDAGVKLNINGLLFPVTLVAFQTHDLGDPVDVSLNNIVNGATPDQLLSEPLIAVDTGVAVKDATGAAETLIHVTCVEMLEPYAFVAFS
jgi:inner membrane protein involved in colicin E2 resistance